MDFAVRQESAASGTLSMQNISARDTYREAQMDNEMTQSCRFERFCKSLPGVFRTFNGMMK